MMGAVKGPGKVHRGMYMYTRDSAVVQMLCSFLQGGILTATWPWRTPSSVSRVEYSCSCI